MDMNTFPTNSGNGLVCNKLRRSQFSTAFDKGGLSGLCPGYLIIPNLSHIVDLLNEAEQNGLMFTSKIPRVSISSDFADLPVNTIRFDTPFNY